MSWRAELRAAVEAGPREGLPDLAAELAHAQAVLMSRLSAPRANGPRAPALDIQPKSKLIDASAAAEILSTNVRWLYDRADDLPFTRRLGPRTLRFDEAALRRWMETRK